MGDTETYRRRSDPYDVDLRKAGIPSERDGQSNAEADADMRRNLDRFKRTDDMSAPPTRKR
jgi:hypothetical protein